jgi:hypothetical protein
MPSTQERTISKQITAHETLTVTARFDDRHSNGHATFSITGYVSDARIRGRDKVTMGGCIHDVIATHLPELECLIPWHLTSTDGPLHYLDNTVYFASDRDHNGLLAGERRQIRNGKTGQLCWSLETVEGKDLPRYVDADTCPNGRRVAVYVPWERIGEGKARELDKARAAAVWPDATDAELCAEPDALRAALLARLPGLLARFRADMEAFGFTWPVVEVTA